MLVHGLAVPYSPPMDNQGFAEQILFGETMADKLASAPPFSEERWLGEMTYPRAPGRPPNLRFRDESHRSPSPPGLRALEREVERGALLHFFANHELMATELMALALLRFRDAPTDFRRVIWNTLQDEQRHLKLYLDRMAELGVAFGDFSVNSLFWRHLSSMRSELEYVTGLCLTYEQANLDFAHGYSAVFTKIGDQDTADILSRIVTDEIGHVRHGVRWIDTFSEGQEGDLFTRHLGNLPPGLTMNAAMGTHFNEELRAHAGLDSSYVDKLLSWAPPQRASGRLLTFNPRAEESLTVGAEPLPNRPESEALESDLSSCVWPIGSAVDAVRVQTRPSPEFVANLKRTGFEPPRFMTPQQLEATEQELTIKPWAATEGVVKTEPTLPFLFSREFDHAMQRLVNVDQKNGVDGTLVTTLEEIDGVAKNYADQQLVLKANYSASGAERIFASGGEPLTDNSRKWARKILRRHGTILIEPWLDRVLDFSIQIEVGAKSRLLGRVFFSNDSRGRYLSHRVDKRPSTIPTDVQRMLNDASTRKTMNAAWHTVADALAEQGYQGPAGIDAMVYRSESGALCLRPIVEVNPRFTFGRIAIELRRSLDANQPILMTILREADCRAAGVDSIRALYDRLSTESTFTPQLQGALALTPIHDTTRWALVLIAGPIAPNSLTAVIAERVTNAAFSVLQSNSAQ